MGFQQGLSGLNVSAKSLETIGNNVANSSTVGFKAARTEFADIYANSFSGVPGQAGLGAQVLAVRQQFSQGNISTSSNSLDLAINGQGFFQLSHNGVVTYTRNGEFSLDKDGFIVASNKGRLQGYPADANGLVTSSAPQDLAVQLGNIAPKATSTATVSLNLDSRDTAPATPFSLTDPTTYNNSTALTAYDVQGNAQTLTLYLRKTGTNAWDVYGASNGTQIGATALGSVTFNTDGSLATGSPLTVTMTGQPGVQGPLSFPVNLADTTQFGVEFAVNQTKQDGYTTGRLAGFNIGADGTVLGQYTNGQSRAQGQIALANFINPQGLTPQGNNQWSESADSGQPTVSTAGTGSLGVLQSGALEESNVDLTAELVNMITAQRAYQANAQTIKTEDSLLQTIVNLR